ncbi:MAG: hypothetical protein IPI67_11095 [Myxococcales bacterium]|nr:hypothetical protein [Myxococcales bacterium]
MSSRLIDLRMADGSRHFGDLPETSDWERLPQAVAQLPGARLTRFLTDDVTEAWLDFEYLGASFSINNQHAQWWFFVSDPACPDEALLQVLDHFERTLWPAAAFARAAGPLAMGSLRAVVYEADGRVSCRDFEDLVEARRYADDAVSEGEDGVVLAFIVDAAFSVVGTGRHY